MSLLDILTGRLPLFKSTQRRQYAHQIEREFETLINAPYHWKQPRTGPYNPTDDPAVLYADNSQPVDCSFPQLREWPVTGVGVLSVLSDTPNSGFKWIINDLQAYLDSTNAVALHYFLLAPGFSFTPAAVGTFVGGGNAPGTIRLGIGKSQQPTSQDFTNISGVNVGEGSPMQFLPGFELESQWKIGVVEMGNTPVTHTLALRLMYSQVPSCASMPGGSKPKGRGGHFALPGQSA